MNRETWLNKAIAALSKDIFKPMLDGRAIPDSIKVSVGFPAGSRGANMSAIGQCWNPLASGGNFIEIFISPVLDEPSRVLDVLCHEMVHAIVGLDAKHGPKFRSLAVAIGLTGRMTATEASPELAEKLAGIAKKIGTFPHAALQPEESGRKKQTTRLIKVSCPTCDNVARQSRTAFLLYGLMCGTCQEQMEAV